MSSTETAQGWARPISSEAQIPEPFRDACLALDLGEPFPGALYGPGFGFGRYRETPKLLMQIGDRLICLDAKRRGIERSELRFGDVHTVQSGTVLLHSWLRFEAHGMHGPGRVHVDFNTVCRDLYQPVLEEYLRQLYVGCECNLEHERAKFNEFLRVDYKFMNLGRAALQPGAEVRRFLLQPRLSRKYLWLLRRTLVPPSLLIATQRELIIVDEGEGRKASRDDSGPYARIWTHLRLDRVQRLWTEAVTASGEEVAQLRVLMRGGASMTVRFGKALESELVAAVNELNLVRTPAA